MRAKANDEPRSPTYYVPNFDPHLEAILLKAIERAPRDRYASAAELLADLRNPAAVPPRDPERGARRRRGGFRVPQKYAVPITVVVILAGLVSLVWLSHRHAAHGPRIPSAETDR